MLLVLVLLEVEVPNKALRNDIDCSLVAFWGSVRKEMGRLRAGRARKMRKKVERMDTILRDRYDEAGN